MQLNTVERSNRFLQTASSELLPQTFEISPEGSSTEKEIVILNSLPLANFPYKRPTMPEFNWAMLMPEAWSTTAPSLAPRKDDTLVSKAGADFQKLLSRVDFSNDESDTQTVEIVSHSLTRYGTDGLAAIRSSISAPRTGDELRHILLVAIARIEDAASRDARRDLIASFLELPDAATRYSAVAALGLFRGERSKALLSERRSKESNGAIIAMITAHLR